ncbi:MAG TPA: hypothetical protein VFP44_13970 [Usitatibacter sp.]|nr:hypothetical protein [Usitatibacter sp.]
MINPADDRERRPVQGQILRRSKRREVAIFLRDGRLWIADFIDGQGALVDAATWFRFNCPAGPSESAYRRMTLESAEPMSGELIGRIERLFIPRRPS